jgi:NAD(P)-dependent dehydrogenase (short-subunit alcohol dehydrogenase family)
VGAATSNLLAARGANVIINYFNNKDAADKVELNSEVDSLDYILQKVTDSKTF